MHLTSLEANCEELTLQYIQAWMLPPAFIRQVEDMQQAGQRHRRRETDSADVPRGGTLDASTLLRVAKAIGEFFTGENTGIALATIHELMSPVLTDPHEEIETLINKVMEEFVTYGKLLDADTDSLGTPATLHARAMAHLTEIALAPERHEEMPEDSSDSEIDWLRSRVDDLARKLTLDPMTSIHNRSYFDMKLEQRIAVASC